MGGLLARLGEAAPFDKTAAWDLGGLHIGHLGNPARSVAVCHEITEGVVASLERDPVDLVVTYHPLLFDPVRSLVGGPTPQGRALRLAEAGIAVVVAHSSFDVAPGGAADALAEALGLEDLQAFGPAWGRESAKVVTFAPAGSASGIVSAMSAAGAGTIGGYTACAFRSEGTGTFDAPAYGSPAAGTAGERNAVPETRIEMTVPAERIDHVVGALVAAHPYEEPAYDVYERRGDAGFLGRIGRAAEPLTVGRLGRVASEVLGGVVRVAGSSEAMLERIAVVPGSGGALLAAAGAAGAQAVVTGDLTHHRARRGLDAGIAVVDPGHVATERPGVARLYAAVSAIAAETRDLRHLDADPWRPAG